VELLRVELSGVDAQAETATGSDPYERGVLGISVGQKEIEGTDHTVVQVMFDEDRPGFDAALLECPLVAEVRTPAGDLISRDLFDHDAFRQRLRVDRDVGDNDLRGVLLLTDGELPPAYLRLAFLPTPLDHMGGCTLVVVRSERHDLEGAIEQGYGDGSLTDGEFRGLMATIEQRHPPRRDDA
jgi:hypothetical protein